MSEINMTAARGHVQALAFARRGGAALGSLLFSIAKRKEEESKGPIETCLFLKTNYSDEEAHSIPVPGSKKGETGNKPFDKYTREVKGPDGTKNEPASWFTDALHDTNEYQVLKTRRDHCKAGQGEDIPADILAMNPAQRATEAERIRIFIKNMRTGLTRGAMLFHHVEAVSALDPARIKVRMPYMKQKDAEGNDVTVVIGSLIRVWDPTDLSDDAQPEILSVSQFLAWDPDKAAKAEGGPTIAALKATATRAPKKKVGEGKGQEYKVPTTTGALLTLFNVLASGIDQESDAGEKQYAALLTKASGKDAEAREARISIAKVCLACDSLWTIIRPMYMIDTENAAKAAVAAMVPKTGTDD